MNGWRFVLLSCGVLAALGVMGCGPDPKDQRIQELTGERDRLRGDLDSKDRELAELSQREQDARRALDQLQEQLRQAQEAAAARPAETEGWVGMPGFDMISIPGDILFDSGKATLRPGGKARLDQIASDILNRYGDREIYVFGHTDTDPIRKSGWKDNWELGAQRALTAARHLLQRGVSPRNLVQANCGEFRPRDSNAQPTGKQRNRRVEFYAVIRQPTGAGRTAEGSAGGP